MSRTRPLFVRPLTNAERAVLQDCLRSSDAFVLRPSGTAAAHMAFLL
jgi:hypothetical protein